mgnify:CR=1 FL=1|tara:strand:+ start:3664 stop:4260 length:597 start_codon:yes stop_codon:yes gene_type:complete
MILVDEIKIIVYDYLENEYKEYLKTNKILQIKNPDKSQNHISLKQTLEVLYDKNIKLLKTQIRSTLKDKYKENYQLLTIENIIMEIFSEKEENINRITDEIQFIQTKNLFSTNIPLLNNSLNLNISIVDNFIVINSVKQENITSEYIELYDKISKYKFIYSINDVVLEEIANENKISTIKELINNQISADIIFYYLKI